MCDNDLVLAIFYAVIGGSWTLYFIMWMIFTYFINRQHIKPLHKILSFIAFFKMLNTDFAALLSFTCREATGWYPYWGLGYTTTYTLYNTFLYTSLILISKGFCITRELLDRGEVTIVAIVMGASYLGFSAYMIQQTELSFALIALMFVYFYLNVKYTVTNIKNLQWRFSILRNTNLPDLLASYSKKINMLKFYLVILHLFFVIQLSLFLAVEIGDLILGENLLRYSDFITIPGIISESLGIMIIIMIFRAKDRGQLFFLSIYQDESEDLRPPPLLSANLPLGFNVANSEEKPMVVLCPQEFNAERPYKAIMLATPYTHGVVLSEESD